MVAAYFDPTALELGDDLFLIPSETYRRDAVFVKKYHRYQVVAPLSRESRSKWTQYLVNKAELASRLIEHFEAMNRFYR